MEDVDKEHKVVGIRKKMPAQIAGDQPIGNPEDQEHTFTAFMTQFLVNWSLDFRIIIMS